MKTVSLTSIFIKNFRSYKEVLVPFNSSAGLKLLSGQNVTEPRLGANGSGKSSLWDALTWCLYGTGIRGSKISSLVSWGTEQSTVTLNISINDIMYVIKRTGPPNKVTINETISTQDQVDALIGLPKHQFLHSVLFGQGIPLFPDLSTPERGLLLDEVLNLDLWNKCSETATKRYTSAEREKWSVKTKLAEKIGALQTIPSNEEITVQIIKWDAERVKTIDDLKRQKENWKKDIIDSADQKEKELASLENELNGLVDVLSDTTSKEEDQLEEIEKQLALYDSQYLTNMKKLTENRFRLTTATEAMSLWKNEVCPSCSQPISDAVRNRNLAWLEESSKDATIQMNEAETMCNLIQSQIDMNKTLVKQLNRELTAKTSKRISAEKDYNRILNRIKAVKWEGEKLVEQLETDSDPYSVQIVQLQNKKNPYIETLNDNKVKKELLEVVIDSMNKDLNNIETFLTAVEFWKTGFKRIRLYFIQQILSSLEIEINSAISALGLEGWSIKLSTETETKSGSIKLGISIHVKSPTAEGNWETWSGGETQRLRLAVALGLGSLIQRSSGTFFTFEIFDEPTNWLSSEGIEDLLECLNYRSQAQKKQIWIVDHRALTYSGFQEIWSAIKDNGTRIEKLSEAA